MPLFGPKHKPPAEVVKVVKEAISVLGQVDNKDEKKTSKAVEDVSRSLASMKSILCGGAEQEQQTETTAQLAQEIYNNHLLLFLIDNLNKIDFEGRKDVVMIFNNLLRRQIGSRYPTVEHICQNRQILTSLMTGYKNQELALNCGVMLRECFRHEELAKMIMHSDEFYKFFDFVEVSTFDISSDAFSTFKELLTRHKSLSAEFLEANYDKFFNQYHILLNSDNYVTRRQALKKRNDSLLLPKYLDFADLKGYVTAEYDGKWWLACILRTFVETGEVEVSFLHPHGPAKSFRYPAVPDILIMNIKGILTALLGELLLDRRNFVIMTRYISQPENLKLVMNMLKESSRNIQFEAFHVFKVFVANPEKPRPIQEILLRNKDKLVDFLTKFHTERSDDEQFNDEKAYLIKQIKDMKPLEEVKPVEEH